jgi:hypothetical protein
MEKNFPSGLLGIKYFYIRLHTLAINECQERNSMFKERARKSMVGMMDVYDKLVQDVRKYLQWPEINFQDEYSISFYFFQELEDTYKVVKGGGPIKGIHLERRHSRFFGKTSK